MPVVTASYLVQWLPLSAWIDITSSVTHVSSGESRMTTNGDNPLAFGDNSESTCEVEVLDTLTAGADVTGRSIRVTFGISGVTTMVFVGVIDEQTESSNSGVVTLGCSGAAERIRMTKAYSPAFYLRPVATKTTISSAEDTSLYSSMGLMNYGLWEAGGRPYEQSGSYPGAAFYYSLDQAMLAPLWSWLAGEDGWSELQKLAQAAGGQLYQDTMGVVRYKQPLNLVGNSPTYTFDSSNYAGASRSRKRGQYASKVIVSFLPREARPVQQVLDDSPIRLIHAGETVSLSFEPQWPLKSLEVATGLKDISSFSGSEQLPSSAVTLTDLTGQLTSPGASGYMHTLEAAAQKLTLSITNTAGKPIVFWRIILRGEPITAGEAGNVEAGSGEAERQITDNPYIQTRGHAIRLSNLILSFYGSARAAIEIEEGVFNPSRYVGEVVNFTASRWGVSGVSHLITRIGHKDTGSRADYTLAQISDLPGLSGYYIVSTSAQTGPKKIGY